MNHVLKFAKYTQTVHVHVFDFFKINSSEGRVLLWFDGKKYIRKSSYE